MKISHAVILAAGRGQRMAPLTDSLPKPMAPYHGSTLIAAGIKRLKKVIPKIHITIGYKKTMLAPHVIENGVCSVLNTEGKGNSWWIYNSLLAYVDEPVFVLTCDNIVDFDSEMIANDYLELGCPPCCLVPVFPVQGLEGDFIHHNDRLVFQVSREIPAEVYCSGIQVINPKLIRENTVEGESFYDVWDQLIARRELFVSKVKPTKWFSVDTIEQLQAANQRTVVA